MKKIRKKWIYQFVTASLLAFVGICLATIFWRGSGSMGQIVKPIFITAMIAHAIGIILGDLLLCRVHRLSILSVFAVVLLEPVGLYIGLFIFGLLVGGDISVFMGWFTHTIISIAGYNSVTSWSRKYRSRHKENQQQ